MPDKRKPLTPKEIAMRSRKARKGGLAMKKKLGNQTAFLVGKGEHKKSEIDNYRY